MANAARLSRDTTNAKSTPIVKNTRFPFVENPNCYIVLHLKDRRRLYGWTEERPSRPEQGNFRIIEGEWLNSDASDAHNGSQYNSAHEIFVIIIPVEDVKKW